MSPRARSRILRIVLIAVALGALRELSVRRHAADLHDWPSAEGVGSPN